MDDSSALALLVGVTACAFGAWEAYAARGPLGLALALLVLASVACSAWSARNCAASRAEPVE